MCGRHGVGDAVNQTAGAMPFESNLQAGPAPELSVFEGASQMPSLNRYSRSCGCICVQTLSNVAVGSNPKGRLADASHRDSPALALKTRRYGLPSHTTRRMR